MKLLSASLVFGVFALMLSACMSAQAVVDPAFPKVSYDDLKKRQAPLRLKLRTEFQRNGQHFPNADSTLRDNVDRVLRASGLIAPTEEGTDGELRVVVNNLADLGSARAKGVGTGLTFGLAGSTVTDNYVMILTLTNKKGAIVQKDGIKHSLHTAIGNSSLPPGLEVVPPGTAFNRVVEQMLLKALKELQESNDI